MIQGMRGGQMQEPMEKPDSSVGDSTSFTSTAPLGLKPPELRDAARTVLGLVTSLVGHNDISRDDPLVELGIDSLASLQLRISVLAEFDVALPVGVVYPHGSVNELAHMLVSECTRQRVEEEDDHFGHRQ
uniref:Carrier domain-containing protein n=1 Tax=Alexandrium andersonii TaxID=327968 RepID=A0A7S2I3Z6_9DINO|mmetsp:Transcript_78061/g.174707  ORF Transcript_78061/g.174707 Transcript_78061/m.174707 type:complete len:130 (+) Transcript_78061:3-392(+)